MAYILIGNPENAAQNTRFNYGVANRATAWNLYNALYQGTALREPGLTFVPAGPFNYSPFIANYQPAQFFEDRNEKVVWPINAADPYTGLGPLPHPAQPTSTATIKEFKNSWNKGSENKPSVEQNSISVHQRGYALTSGDSFKYFLNTQSMSPCITIIVWNKSKQTAALAHVDKNQDFSATVDALFNRVTGTAADPVRVHFHGGNCTYPQRLPDPYTGVVEQVSSNTAVELLTAILGRGDTNSICISTFDVLARPHGNAVAFNTRNGQILPEIGERTTIQLDAPFRLINVRPEFAAQYPENFYAQGTNDVLSQIANFNGGLGREATDVDTANNPISVASIRAPRLQTDLRAVETAHLLPGGGPAPIIAFLNQTKSALFTWAGRRIFSLAGAAGNPPYSPNDIEALRAILLTAAGVPPALPDITRLDQAVALYNGLVKFENIVKKPKPEAVPEAEWVPYLQTVAREVRAGSNFEAAGKASATWTKKYGFA